MCRVTCTIRDNKNLYSSTLCQNSLSLSLSLSLSPRTVFPASFFSTPPSCDCVQKPFSHFPCPRARPLIRTETCSIFPGNRRRTRRGRSDSITRSTLRWLGHHASLTLATGQWPPPLEGNHSASVTFLFCALGSFWTPQFVGAGGGEERERDTHTHTHARTHTHTHTHTHAHTHTHTQPY